MQSGRSNRQKLSRHRQFWLVSFGLLLALFGMLFPSFDSLGLSNGFGHPWEGWDHLVTMLAVGIWAAQLRGQAIWMLPLAFVGVMGLGGIAGAEGFSIPHAEGIIFLSCAVFGVLITHKIRFGAKINVLIVAFFAFFHGFAHGQEISASASLISYVLGFMLATLLLHGAGILVAKLVVFSITCLLTVGLSNVALAKTTADSVNSLKDNGAVTNQDQITSFALYANQMGYDWSYLAPFETALQAVSDPEDHLVATGSRCASSGKMSVLKTINERLKTQSHGIDLFFKPFSYQAVLRGQSLHLANIDFVSHGCLSFKHYYPDINHTPGNHLLSNGVGLTSPPVANFHVLASQTSPNFHQIPLPFVEDLHLRLDVGKHNTGQPVVQTAISAAPASLSANRCQVRQFAYTSFLTAVVIQNSAGCLSHGSDAVSRLSSMSSKPFFAGLFTAWPRHFNTIKSII